MAYQVWDFSVGGGVTCPAPMTMVELRTLRNNAELDTNCQYIINDYVNGNITASAIMLHATASDQLALKAEIKTQYDNSAWHGLYDIDLNEIIHLEDNLSNSVTGAQSVADFDWGVTSVNGNTIKNSTLVRVGREFSDNTVISATVTTNAIIRRSTFLEGCDVNIDSTSATTDSSFGSNCSVTATGASRFTDADIGNSSVVNLSDSAWFRSGDADSSAIINMSGTSRTFNFDVSANARLTLSGSAIVNSGSMRDRSELTLISGSHTNVTVSSYSVINQVGTGTLSYCNIRERSIWTLGDVNLNQIDAFSSNLNTTGSSGAITAAQFNNADMTNLQNIVSVNINGLIAGTGSRIQANSAGLVQIADIELGSDGFIRVFPGKEIDARSGHIRSVGRATVTDGKLILYNSDISSVGSIDQNSSGTNTVNSCDIKTNGILRFSGDNDLCTALQVNISSNRTVEFRTGSSGSTIQRGEYSGSGNTYISNSPNAILNVCEAHSASTMHITNSPNNQMIYCNATERGTLGLQNNTGIVKLENVKSETFASCVVQNTAVDVTMRSCTFSNEFKVFITLTATALVRGLWGNVPDTVTITDPTVVAPPIPATGVAAQNFN